MISGNTHYFSYLLIIFLLNVSKEKQRNPLRLKSKYFLAGSWWGQASVLDLRSGAKVGSSLSQACSPDPLSGWDARFSTFFWWPADGLE